MAAAASTEFEGASGVGTVDDQRWHDADKQHYVRFKRLHPGTGTVGGSTVSYKLSSRNQLPLACADVACGDGCATLPECGMTRR